MKHKKQSLLLSLLILAVTLSICSVSAVDTAMSFNQGGFYYNISEGQTQCQTVKILSTQDNGFLPFDQWIPNALLENASSLSLNAYTANATDFGITITYPKHLTYLQHEFEVCITENQYIPTLNRVYKNFSASQSSMTKFGYVPMNIRGDLVLAGDNEPSSGVIIRYGLWLFVNTNPYSPPASNNDAWIFGGIFAVVVLGSSIALYKLKK